MIESHERVEEFKAEVADMRLRDPATARDRLLLRVGWIAMIVGVATTLVCYFLSHGSTGSAAYLDQGDYTILAIFGLALTVAGAALFVRYSTAQFLRFWLARFVYEQQAQTDRVVDAVGGGTKPGPDRVVEAVRDGS